MIAPKNGSDLRRGAAQVTGGGALDIQLGDFTIITKDKPRIDSRLFSKILGTQRRPLFAQIMKYRAELERIDPLLEVRA